MYTNVYNTPREHADPHRLIRRLAEEVARRQGGCSDHRTGPLGAARKLCDCEPVGGGVSEMRVHIGPGYRVYFTRRGKTIYVLLTGGDKSSQQRDIKRAIEMARQLKE